MDPRLLVYVVYVALHRVLRDAEAVADVQRVTTPHKHEEHLRLALGQTVADSHGVAPPLDPVLLRGAGVHLDGGFPHGDPEGHLVRGVRLAHLVEAVHLGRVDAHRERGAAHPAKQERDDGRRDEGDGWEDARPQRAHAVAAQEQDGLDEPPREDDRAEYGAGEPARRPPTGSGCLQPVAGPLVIEPLHRVFDLLCEARTIPCFELMNDALKESAVACLVPEDEIPV